MPDCKILIFLYFERKREKQGSMMPLWVGSQEEDRYLMLRLYIKFIIMQGQHSSGCENCKKKEQMIQKYLHLIDLLKKKNQIPNLSNSLKDSIDGGTTSNTSLQHIKSPKTSLIAKMADLQRRRKLEGFRRMQQKAVQQKCHKGFRLALTLQRCICRRLQEGVRSLYLVKGQVPNSLLKVQNQIEKSGSMGGLDSSSNPKNLSCFFPSNSFHGKDKICALSRKIFAMNKEIEALRWSNKGYEEQIEENVRRQQIESKKKKESLEMLAEQMGEKNELITELQTALRFYESRQGRTVNCVLDEEGVALRRQLQNMEQIHEKLNLELSRRNDQLAKIEQQKKELSEKVVKLESQNAILKQRNFQMGVQLQGLQKKKQDYYNLTSFLEKKLNNLKKYQKIISANLKVIEQHSCSDRSSFNISTRMKTSLPNVDQVAEANEEKLQASFSPISHFEAQYKIQKILNYVFNIELEDVWITNQEKLFDSEELEVLNTLKHKFIQLNQQIKVLQKKDIHSKNDIPEHRLHTVKRESGEDQVYFNQHHMSGSIFEVLESQKTSRPSKDRDDHMINEFQSKGCPYCSQNRHNGSQTIRRDNQNFTIKLLELQLQKNKQIQKISQLKNKLMHIRCIVMNFLKSLDLKSLKTEAKDIVEIFFELFQYSEEEKDVIVHQNQKEKRFFGFF